MPTVKISQAHLDFMAEVKKNNADALARMSHVTEHINGGGDCEAKHKKVADAIMESMIEGFRRTFTLIEKLFERLGSCAEQRVYPAKVFGQEIPIKGGLEGRDFVRALCIIAAVIYFAHQKKKDEYVVGTLNEVATVMQEIKQ
jgi:hypothetical protein